MTSSRCAAAICHRGDRRAAGLEARSVRENRAVRRARTRSFASNTSGLVDQCACRTRLTQALRHRFCGVHFFNPPRYMHLVELIPDREDRPRDPRPARSVSDDHARQRRRPRQRHAELHRQPHRRVLDSRDDASHRSSSGSASTWSMRLPARDRPSEERRRIARPMSSASTRMAHVIKTMDDTLPDDPWHRYYKTPPCCRADRTRARSARKPARAFTARSARTSSCSIRRNGTTRRQAGKAATKSAAILKIRIAGRAVRADCARSSDPQAQFLWAIFRDLFHYAAFHLADIADNARDVDFAIRWGYGWKLGPFETWQAAGWQQVAHGSPKTSRPARR